MRELITSSCGGRSKFHVDAEKKDHFDIHAARSALLTKGVIDKMLQEQRTEKTKRHQL